jgi:predicted nuclease of restriction endonuclease-like (RecB) superfamily
MTKPAISSYDTFLHDLKTRIRAARTRAALAVNHELIMLYWQIGRDILDRQEREGWGAKVIEKLASDLRAEFPDMKGFSRANLMYMRSFAAAWESDEIVQRLVGQIPWGQNITLVTKVKSRDEREWYAKKVVEKGWSRPVLEHQIESGLIHRQGKRIYDHFVDVTDMIEVG